jgi:hypothetical protein
VSERDRLLITIIYLLQKEVECLISVLSEWEQDKSIFIQYNRAEVFARARESLEHQL